MQSQLRSVFLFILLSIMSVHSYATSEKHSVVLDSPTYTLDTQFRALILQPSASNLHYAAQATPLPIQSPHWDIYDVHPGYSFGFDLGVRAVFHTRDTNLSVNWEHFKSRTCAAHQVPVDTDMIGPFFAIGPDTQQYKNAVGTICFAFDNVNLTYGQYAQWGDFLQTNLFAGIDFTQIKQTITAFYADEAGTTHRTIVTPITFRGAGPQIGADFSYDIVKGLNLTGHVTAALLVGSSCNYTTYISVFPPPESLEFPSPNIQSTSTQKSTQLVPEFAQRLGLAYFFSYREHYMTKVEAGYEARVYISALQSVDLSSQVVTPPVEASNVVGVFARTFHKSLSNFALAGPYVALSMAF